MKIWLTGGSGSGKSAVARLFSENGFRIVDADKIAREIVRPGERALSEIIETFGLSYLLPDGTLDRKKLGNAVFADKEKLAALNGITHTYIIEEMRRQAENESNVVFDAPLRNTFGIPCDKTLYVAAPVSLRIARIMERDGLSRTEAAKRIEAQDREALYAADADVTLQNDGDISALRTKTEHYIKDWFTS